MLSHYAARYELSSQVSCLSFHVRCSEGVITIYWSNPYALYKYINERIRHKSRFFNEIISISLRIGTNFRMVDGATAVHRHLMIWPIIICSI